MYLLRRHHFADVTDEVFYGTGQCKLFQHPLLSRELAHFVKPDHAIADIGAKGYFAFLKNSPARTKFIIDPYASGPGAGLESIPKLPYPIGLFRCLVGVDSSIIPSGMFDVTFSCSVLEHIGQEACGYDCNPVRPPPDKQEAPRRAFSQELFRITKPGGVTLHTIDHAPRNLTWIDNLLEAGFVQIDELPRPTVQEALEAPDLVRQRVHWTKLDQPIPASEQRLHSVLYVRMKKP